MSSTFSNPMSSLFMMNIYSYILTPKKKVISPSFYLVLNLVVKASPSTKIFFLFIAAGKVKIITIDRNTIKSKGNLPIPHSEKAKAKVVNCIFNFFGQN